VITIHSPARDQVGRHESPDTDCRRWQAVAARYEQETRNKRAAMDRVFSASSIQDLPARADL